MKLLAIKAEKLECVFCLFFFFKQCPEVIYLFSWWLISKKRDLCLIAWLPRVAYFSFHDYFSALHRILSVLGYFFLDIFWLCWCLPALHPFTHP